MTVVPSPYLARDTDDRSDRGLREQDAHPRLTRAEWRAVAIALQDAAQGEIVARREHTLLARLFRWAAGSARPRALANPRLEAVRSFVAEARAHRRVNPDLTRSLRAQGFSSRQIEALDILSR